MAGQPTNYRTYVLIDLQMTILLSEASGTLPDSLAQDATLTSYYLSASGPLMYLGVSDSLLCGRGSHLYISN